MENWAWKVNNWITMIMTYCKALKSSVRVDNVENYENIQYE